MIKLFEPSEKYLKSYIDAYNEQKNLPNSGYHFSDPSLEDIFQKYENYKYEKNLPSDRVGASYFWLVDDEKDYFIGEVNIRHRLNAFLERYAGHIGYVVRCSEWNKGYGTLMLKLALEEARKLGLGKVLVTCDDDNIASSRVMEKNGFVFTDKITNVIDGETILTRRYWKTL